MTGLVDLHSRVVFWLKIVLPLAALVILSTLFLFPRRFGTDGALPYSQVDLQELAREQVLHGSRYQAVTSDGAALTFVAGRVTPGNGSDGASAADLSVRYETSGGFMVRVVAADGNLNTSENTVQLSGDVKIETSTGYDIVATALDAALDRTRLASDGAVTVTAPYGTIEAGQMELGKRTGTGSYDLVFTRGVKLVYQPRTKGAE
ncbi:MAG: LPS export ABC transporter periplasmic protein LptC [Rhodobacteraceae bacterium]|nr:LPS export ABC transporter periplasmic protein LptC [Paracoccaceae bacterium]